MTRKKKAPARGRKRHKKARARPAGKPSPRPGPDLHCIWEGDFFAVHSLALVNRKICAGLLRKKVDLCLANGQRGTLPDENDLELLLLNRHCGRRLKAPPDIHVRHAWPPDFRPPAQGRWVIMQHWEFGSLPRDWIRPLREEVDEVWVASHFVRDCFKKSGVPEERLQVIPLGVDTELFCPQGPLYKLPATKSFRFLFVGGTIQRKGIHILLDAWTEHFRAEDDVCLVLKDMGGKSFYKGRTAKERIQEIQARPGAAEILHLEQELTNRELAALYRSCQCLVQPYMGEGFGLPIAEAMASGLPVVVTGHGAAMDFCSSQNAHLIPASKCYLPEQQVGALPTVGRPFLAKPDCRILGRTMRRIFENPEQADEKAARGRETICSSFTWQKSVERVLARLAWLKEQPIRRLEKPRHEQAREPAQEAAAPSRPAAQASRVPAAHNRKRGSAGLGLRVAANVFNYSGYARLGRDLLPALGALGTPLQLESLGHDPCFVREINRNPEAVELWNNLTGARVHGGCYLFFHPPQAWDGYDFLDEAVRHNPGFQTYAALTMFETDRLPPGWSDCLNRMDEVWVPSRFNLQSFARGGVERGKLRLVRPGINGLLYAKRRRPFPLPEAGFTFLSVFQWTLRKGWDVLLKAYLSAFTARDDVLLAIRSYPGRLQSPPIKDRLRAFLQQSGRNPASLPRIHLIEEFVSEEDLPSLYQAADAYVLPTRGEGVGLPFMEAMASGLPTIGTRWSAQLDFMNDANSFLIDVEGTETVRQEQCAEDPYYTSDQRWAAPSVEHTAALLREVFEQPERARKRGRLAQQEIQEHWTLPQAAKSLLTLLQLSKSKALGRTSSVAQRLRAEQAAAQKAPLLWTAPLYDPSGYAEEARSFLTGLAAINQPVAARHRSWSRRAAPLDEETRTLLKRLLHTEPAERFISVQHGFPTHFTSNAHAAVRVGRTMFETDALPAAWVACCNQMDEIWVPSDWNVQSFARAGVDPARLFKIPGTIPASHLTITADSLELPERRTCAFLSVFDWSLRKGWDLLVGAFAAEFREDEDVVLYLKVHSSLGYSLLEMQQQMANVLRQEGHDPARVPPVVLLTQAWSSERMLALYRSVDAYVMPSRGEGWGRPYMEAMAAARPVIGTSLGGNTAFMNRQNAYLIDARLAAVPPAALREAPLFCGQRWAEPERDHLRVLLRQVSRGGKKCQQRALRGQRDLERRFTSEHVARLIMRRSTKLLEQARLPGRVVCPGSAF